MEEGCELCVAEAEVRVQGRSRGNVHIVRPHLPKQRAPQIYSHQSQFSSLKFGCIWKPEGKFPKATTKSHRLSDLKTENPCLHHAAGEKSKIKLPTRLAPSERCERRIQASLTGSQRPGSCTPALPVLSHCLPLHGLEGLKFLFL